MDDKIELKHFDSNLFNYFNASISRITPSEFAEEYRYMGTSETRWAGKYSFDITPYLREVLDCLDPSVPVTDIAVMKAAQIGYSTGVIENGLCWIISQYPANSLLMAADDDAVKLAIAQKIDPAIDSCGLSHLIGATKTSNRQNKRTGDTRKEKEFPGGRLYAYSVKNAGKMRQFSAKYCFLDDLDSGKLHDEKEGSIVKLVDGRTTTFGDTRKVFYISTPIIKQHSLIEPMFLKGDQRYYNVPCPRCGSYIPLKWSVDVKKKIHKSGKAGVVWDLEKDGSVIQESVGYICQDCGKLIDESEKYDMNLDGVWTPTVKPKTPNFRSYHISALYSPPGAISWGKMAQEWVECFPRDNGGKANIPNLKTFLNIRLGQTYEDRGKANDALKLALNTRNEYNINVVPKKLSIEDGNGRIVMLTVSADLNGTIDDARLDYLVNAWCETGSSYCVDHGSIGSYQGRKTKKDDEREIMSYRNEVRNNVWDKLYSEVINKEYKSDDGSPVMKPMFCVIDTGFHTSFAYTFMDQYPGLVAGVKGMLDKYNLFNDNSPRYKESAIRKDLFILDVNKYKDELSDRMQLKWVEFDKEQPYGFMNFPMPAEGKFSASFFNHYAGEVRKYKLNDDGSALGSMWVKKSSNVDNHYWDCDVYNAAARDIFVYLYCTYEKIKKPTWQTFISLIFKGK